MSQVRVPKTGERVLPFCRPWHDRQENPCFESYAEMMVFGAALGFAHLEGRRPQGCGDFLTQPYPIAVEIFKSQQLFPILLLLGLAVTRQHQITRDEKRLCGLVEDYADIGFTQMQKILEKTSPEEFHGEMARLLTMTS